MRAGAGRARGRAARTGVSVASGASVGVTRWASAGGEDVELGGDGAEGGVLACGSL